LASAFAQVSVIAGECVALVARDGTTVGFTSLDEEQVIDLSDDGGPADLSCDQGMVLSAITLAVGLDASFAEVQGPVGPVVTAPAVDGGKWDGAEAWLVRVSPGVAGFAPILRGHVAEARVEGPRFVFEIRNQADMLNQQIGRTITAYCDATFGDARCGFAVAAEAATVTAVTDALRFTVSTGGSFADEYFNLGKVTFTSGALNGVIADNIASWTSAGAIELFEPLPAAPEVGDTLDLARGCGKTRTDCMGFGNIVNFRGFPDVPGTDQVLRYPNPGG
jgi:uncharacterized phage protein (TIGR02218 family)